ncbi:MAG: HNH endonuclease [Paracoccaceae bacterium]|nr:HNH endonuclease [Paracoccaceae bacterium]MDE2912438.1 HNH endonuclease [Paracoccaceae bacterium]
MRPVAKGPPPQAEYSHYRDALSDLESRIGRFCSYCEQPIQHAPEIEHVQPKSLEPALERSWDNLLLGCMSCNRTKSNKPVELAQVAMPDMDNTFRGLVFLQGGHIEVSPDLTDEQDELMGQIVRLVRLDRHPDSRREDDRPTDRDKRADLRCDVWDLAIRYLGYIEKPGRDPLLSSLIAEDLAPSKGFFSVWMTVFRNHPDMLERFIRAFPGTDTTSFNAEGQAVCRPGGRL